MNKKFKDILIFLIVVSAILAGIYILFPQKSQPGNSQPGKLDNFAKCLGEKGAVFYGAFWCSHCQNQKAMFGTSQKLLPYTECSTPDGNNQLTVCRDKNIEGYPTWEFSDASREMGEVPLEKLSEKTSCVIP